MRTQKRIFGGTKSTPATKSSNSPGSKKKPKKGGKRAKR